MPSTRPATTIRFTDEDREILASIRELTGSDSDAACIRMALRTQLATLQRGRGRKGGK